MNVLVARLLSASLCVFVVACADSTVPPPDTATPPGSTTGAQDAGSLSYSPNGDGGTVELGAARRCADVPIDVFRPACVADGWCWSHPLPQGNALTSSVGFTDESGSTTELWSVGALGTSLRLRSGIWEPVATGTTRQLNAIWGTAPDDLWAVGEAGTIVHYDGTVWSPVDSHDDADLTSVWGSGRRDVWVGGMRGHVLHWDGSSFTRSPNPVPNHVRGLWGAPSSSRVNETSVLWAVGDDGAQMKWTEGRWSIVPPLHPYSSYAVFGTASNNVWTGGQWGMATHFDGLEWSPSPTRSPFGIRAMGGTGPADIWAVGESGLSSHFDGKSWTSDLLGNGETLQSVWACGENSVWMTGSSGRVIQWTEDKSYTIRTKGFLAGGLHGGDFVEMRTISGTGPNDIWVAASTGLLHWDGTTWNFVSTSFWGSPYAAWASGPNDMYFVGYIPKGNNGLPETHLVHYDGNTFAEPAHPKISIITGTDSAFGGSGPNDIWLTAQEGLLHYDGRTWELAESRAGGARVVVPRAGVTWVVGSGFFHRYAAGSLTSYQFPEWRPFLDLWASSDTDAWAVGYSGALARWNGTEWTLVPPATDRHLRAVWGASATDIWAAGDGVVLHYDGTTWTPSYSVTTNALGARMSGGLWGSSSKDVWVIGARGTILRRQLP